MNESLKALAEKYLTALNRKPFERSSVEDLLNEKVSYASPTGSGEGVSNLLSELQGFHRCFETLRHKRVFVEEGELCVLYEATSSHNELGSLEVVEWLKVEGSKISSIRSIYDARPLERLRTEI